MITLLLCALDDLCFKRKTGAITNVKDATNPNSALNWGAIRLGDYSAKVYNIPGAFDLTFSLLTMGLFPAMTVDRDQVLIAPEMGGRIYLRTHSVGTCLVNIGRPCKLGYNFFDIEVGVCVF